jgi:hypothetical protein
MKMVTVEDVNKAFLEKDVEINLHYTNNWIITSIKTLEKKHDLNGRVAFLTFPDDKRQGDKDFRDMFLRGKGSLESKTSRKYSGRL